MACFVSFVLSAKPLLTSRILLKTHDNDIPPISSITLEDLAEAIVLVGIFAMVSAESVLMVPIWEICLNLPKSGRSCH